jgi:hypothetical protein
MTHTEREWRDGQPEGTRPDEDAAPLAEHVPEDDPLVEHVRTVDPLAETAPDGDPLVEEAHEVDPLVEHVRTDDPLAELAPGGDPLVEEAQDKDPLAEPVPAAVASADAVDVGQTGPAGLGSADDQERFTARWQEIQAGFVDEPRRAVQDADALVVDMMDRLARMLASEREQLESRGETGKVSTEDLRQGLRRYRSLFERLLAV